MKYLMLFISIAAYGQTTVNPPAITLDSAVAAAIAARDAVVDTAVQ